MTDPAVPEAPARHAFLRYNLARLGILTVTLFVFWLLGFRSLALFLVGFLVSGAISFIALRGLRAEAAGSLQSGYRRMSDRIDAQSRSEDDD